MQDFVANFGVQFSKSVPLFLLIAVGYALSRWGGFPKQASSALSKFAFNVALSAMLFRLISQLYRSETSADPKLLVAFFGACVIVMFSGRFLARTCLKLEPVGATIFGTGCVFSNNGLLGLPLAIVMLGPQYVPSVATVLSVNAMILWTLVSITVELSTKSGNLSLKSFLRTVFGVFKNPLIASIFAGVLWNVTRLELPYVVDEPLRLLGASATPLSLVVVGMGLAEYGIGKGLGTSMVLSMIKLCIQPLVVFAIARLIGLGAIETTAVVFLGSLPCGVNVYLMSNQFKTLQAEVANAMLITTVTAAVTVPFVVTVFRHVS